MTTHVRIAVVGPSRDVQAAVAEAEAVFAEVERTCTRFDPESDLMRANAAGQEWSGIGRYCLAAIEAAAGFHHDTEGLFDPRILTALTRLGYDRTWSGLGHRGSGLDPADLPELLLDLPGPAAERVPPWQPELDLAGGRARIGQHAIDLGGIGKGLALRWAAQALDRAGAGFLIEAGGDCVMHGRPPDGASWRIGVERPFSTAPTGAPEPPVAVLAVNDLACATSSVRKRAWRVGGELVHHVIDPRTGRSAAGRLRSVTVICDDPARAEVWSKALLIAGDAAVAALADRAGVAALWIGDDARMATNAAMHEHLLWAAGDVA